MRVVRPALAALVPLAPATHRGLFIILVPPAAVLSKAKYTEDELRLLAKEGGNTSYKYARDAKGKIINKQLRKDGSKARQKEPIVSKAIVGINKGDKGTDIIVDSVALQKTLLPVGPDERIRVFGKQGIDLDYGDFDDFDDYLDFDEDLRRGLEFYEMETNE